MRDFLVFKDSFFKLIAINYIVLLVVYFLGDSVFSSFSQGIISISCGTTSIVEPTQAAAIISSGFVSFVFSVVFGFYGRFSSEELKINRRGSNVLIGCGLAIIMIVYFCIFMLPCDDAVTDLLLPYKARLGSIVLGYIRHSYFIFIAFLSVLAGGGAYCLALAIKLTVTRSEK